MSEAVTQPSSCFNLAACACYAQPSSFVIRSDIDSISTSNARNAAAWLRCRTSTGEAHLWSQKPRFDSFQLFSDPVLVFVR
jgi:hypothetical protein